MRFAYLTFASGQVRPNSRPIWAYNCG